MMRGTVKPIMRESQGPRKIVNKRPIPDESIKYPKQNPMGDIPRSTYTPLFTLLDGFMRM